jgi:hypothetical protein
VDVAPERWRKGPAVPSAEPGKSAALAGEILGGRAGGGVRHRRMVDLARYGMAAKAGALRMLATLLTTVVYRSQVDR